MNDSNFESTLSPNEVKQGWDEGLERFILAARELSGEYFDLIVSSS